MIPTVPLSAVLIVKNAEATLDRTLVSAAFCDEIVVLLDAGSSDRSRAIAESRGARVHTRTFDDFAAQKNHAVSLARNEWVLSLDADEQVTPELAAEIQRLIGSAASASSAASAYRIRRRTYFLNRLLRFGGHQSDRPVRLFRRSAARFEGRVHEEVRVKGSTRDLTAPLLHFTTASAREYFRKLNHYTDLEAQALQAGGSLFWKPTGRFVQKYLAQLGFLDGWAGFVYAVLSGYYEFVRQAKFWQKSQNISANM